jgi:hypothetical protein
MRIPKIYHFGNLSAVPEGKLVLDLYPVSLKFIQYALTKVLLEKSSRRLSRPVTADLNHCQ